MKLLFVHNGPVFYDNKGNYYEYSYHGLLERYSYIAKDISFLMRTMPCSTEENYDLVPKEIRVISVKNMLTPIGYFKYMKDVYRIIEKAVRENDYLILRGGIYSDIAIRYAKKYKKPYIYECVGCTWDALWNHSLLGKVIAPVFFLNTKRIIKNAPYVEYVTDKFLENRYPTRGHWIGCSDICIGSIDEEILKLRLNKIKGFDMNGEILLGTAAAIDVRYKGQEYVIEAVRMLNQRGINVKYYLAGGNRKRSTFLERIVAKNHLEKNVIFLGALNHDKINDFYDSLDIYIQPSKLEGLPRAVIEAMSRGWPVLGSDVGGIPELLDNECLFKKGSSKAIFESLLRMINSDISKYAKKNYEKANDYLLDKIETKRNNFYEKFLSRT